MEQSLLLVPLHPPSQDCCDPNGTAIQISEGIWTDLGKKSLKTGP